MVSTKKEGGLTNGLPSFLQDTQFLGIRPYIYANMLFVLTFRTKGVCTVIVTINGCPLRQEGGLVSCAKQKKRLHPIDILAPTAVLLAQGHSAFAASLGDNTAFKGDGHYLLDIVVIAAFSMVIVTICKLAGRGEIAGVVLFLSGCVVLIDVIKVFTHLYGAIAGFIS